MNDWVLAPLNAPGTGSEGYSTKTAQDNSDYFFEDSKNKYILYLRESFLGLSNGRSNFFYFNYSFVFLQLQVASCESGKRVDVRSILILTSKVGAHLKILRYKRKLAKVVSCSINSQRPVKPTVHVALRLSKHDPTEYFCYCKFLEAPKISSIYVLTFNLFFC